MVKNPLDRLRKEMEEKKMWKCSSCGEENGDASNVCISCGARRNEKSATTLNQPRKEKSAPSPNECFSSEALEIASWADKFLAITIIAAILVAIALSFQPEIDRWGDIKTTFSGMSLLLKGIPVAGGVSVGGYTFYVILRGLSVMVEASYRSMMPHKEQ